MKVLSYSLLCTWVEHSRIVFCWTIQGLFSGLGFQSVESPSRGHWMHGSTTPQVRAIYYKDCLILTLYRIRRCWEVYNVLMQNSTPNFYGDAFNMLLPGYVATCRSSQHTYVLRQQHRTSTHIYERAGNIDSLGEQDCSRLLCLKVHCCELWLPQTSISARSSLTVTWL